MGSEQTGKPKFVVDCMLGKLAKWLRLVGYDTAYMRDAQDDALVRQAVREDRILLTKDNLLAQRRLLRNRCIFVEEEGTGAQLREVMRKLSLRFVPDDMFTRCMVCNGEIEAVPKESVKALVPPYVHETQEEFGRCGSCGKIYWRGTHVDHVMAALRQFKPDPVKRDGLEADD